MGKGENRGTGEKESKLRFYGLPLLFPPPFLLPLLSRWWPPPTIYHSRSTFAVTIRLLLLVATTALLGVAAQGQGVPQRPSPAEGLVIDRVGLLTPGEEASLERRLVAFDDTSSSQIVVVILPTIGGADAATFATELGRRWGVGQAGRDNGIVVLVAPEEREVFIAVGYGLEGAIPDALAGRIVRNEIIPAFRQERYYDGLSRAVDALIAAAAGEYTRTRPGTGDPTGPDLALLFIVLIIVVFVLSAARKGNTGGGDGGGTGGHQRRPVRRRRSSIPPIIVVPGGWGSSRSSGWGGMGGLGGGGFGGGGFGGFGGGGFGGGGAGGRW
jgi:uncharacterized protein